MALNENIKNNLHNLNNKINERQNINAVRAGNEIIKKIDDENHSDVVAENLELLKDQKQEQERCLKTQEPLSNNVFAARNVPLVFQIC